MLRRFAIVAVIARGLAGQQHMEGVVIVVVPLRAIFAVRRVGERIEQARLVGVVFQHQMNVPCGLGGEPAADGLAELRKQYRALGLGDRVHGVEPQAVEAKVAQPIERVLDCEPPHLRIAP